MYFKVKPDSQLAWNLIEQSIDNTVHRPLDVTEDPSEVIDFWGKSKVQPTFTVITVLLACILTNHATSLIVPLMQLSVTLKILFFIT